MPNSRASAKQLASFYPRTDLGGTSSSRPRLCSHGALSPCSRPSQKCNGHPNFTNASTARGDYSCCRPGSAASPLWDRTLPWLPLSTFYFLLSRFPTPSPTASCARSAPPHPAPAASSLHLQNQAEPSFAEPPPAQNQRSYAQRYAHTR
jgi:hypothetical protein